MDLAKQLQQARERLAALEAEHARVCNEVAQCRAVGGIKVGQLAAQLIDASACVTMDGRIVETNAAFQQMLGYSADELLQRNYRDITPSQWHEQEAKIIAEQVLPRGASEIYEKEYRHKDGRVFPVELRTILIRDADGAPCGMWAFARDISERKQAEEALAESRAMLQLVLDTIPVRVFWKDCDLRYLGANQLLAQDTGFASPAELIGKNDFDTVARAQAERYRADDRAVIDSGVAKLNYVEPQTTATGGVAWLSTSKIPLRNSQGEIIGILGVYEDISERKEAEAALIASEQRWRILLQTVAVGVVVHDRDTRILESNAAARALLGLSATEIMGKQAIDFSGRFVTEEGVPVTQAELPVNLVLARKQALRGRVFGITHPEHPAVSWVLVNADPVYGEDGTLREVIVVFMDITELKLAEERLRAQTDFNQRIFDSTDAHLAIVGPDGTIQAINVAWRRFAEENGGGDEHAWGVGASYFRAVSPDWGDTTNAEAAFAGVRQVLNGRLPSFEMEYPCHAGPFGIRRWFIVRVQPLRGQPGTVVVSHINITALKEAEMALEQERALLSTGIDILPFPIIFETTSGMILRVNHAAHGLYPDQDVVMEDTVPQLQFLEPGTRQAVPDAQCPQRRALRGEVITSVEYILLLPDGREIPVLVQAAPIFVKEALIGVVMALQDISMLKAADTAKDQFLMVLSHELKTPLTSILGWAQAAQTITEHTPQALGIIVRNAQEQARILDDLLDVSRLITGRLALTREATDLGALARYGAENAIPAAEARGLTVRVEVAATPLPIMADPGRIMQAISNLLTNAIKFTEPGGEIRVRAFQQYDQAVLEVQDTGRGIDPEELPWLFRPFLQLRREEQTGGLGLGLSLVKGIVELHGGHVQAQSPGRGEGSTFTVTVPLSNAEPSLSE